MEYYSEIHPKWSSTAGKSGGCWGRANVEPVTVFGQVSLRHDPRLRVVPMFGTPIAAGLEPGGPNAGAAIAGRLDTLRWASFIHGLATLIAPRCLPITTTPKS